MPNVEETKKLRRRWRVARLAAGMTVTALVVAGCAPGESTTEPTETETSGISNVVPTDVDINLTLATWEVGGLFDSIQSIVKATGRHVPGARKRSQLDSHRASNLRRAGGPMV